MTHIFDSVIEVIIATPNSRLTADKCLIDFLQNLTTALTLSERHNTAKPGGYFLVKDWSDKNTISWADVVLSCEYKLKDLCEDLDDVVSLVAVVHLLFTLGHSEVHMEYAASHVGRSMPLSHIRHDHWKYHNKAMVLLPVFGRHQQTFWFPFCMCACIYICVYFDASNCN